MILGGAANQARMLYEQANDRRQALGELRWVGCLRVKSHAPVGFEAKQKMVPP
jgi:hypothetical protein